VCTMVGREERWRRCGGVREKEEGGPGSINLDCELDGGNSSLPQAAKTGCRVQSSIQEKGARNRR